MADTAKQKKVGNPFLKLPGTQIPPLPLPPKPVELASARDHENFTKYIAHTNIDTPQDSVFDNLAPPNTGYPQANPGSILPGTDVTHLMRGVIPAGTDVSSLMGQNIPLADAGDAVSVDGETVPRRAPESQFDVDSAEARFQALHDQSGYAAEMRGNVPGSVLNVGLGTLSGLKTAAGAVAEGPLQFFGIEGPNTRALREEVIPGVIDHLSNYLDPEHYALMMRDNPAGTAADIATAAGGLSSVPRPPLGTLGGLALEALPYGSRMRMGLGMARRMFGGRGVPEAPPPAPGMPTSATSVRAPAVREVVQPQRTPVAPPPLRGSSLPPERTPVAPPPLRGSSIVEEPARASVAPPPLRGSSLPAERQPVAPPPLRGGTATERPNVPPPPLRGSSIAPEEPRPAIPPPPLRGSSQKFFKEEVPPVKKKVAPPPLGQAREVEGVGRVEGLPKKEYDFKFGREGGAGPKAASGPTPKPAPAKPTGTPPGQKGPTAQAPQPKSGATKLEATTKENLKSTFKKVLEEAAKKKKGKK